MFASMPDASWQDGTMTSADHMTLLLPQARAGVEGHGIVHSTRLDVIMGGGNRTRKLRLVPIDLRKLPAVVLVEGLATPKADAAP